MGIHRYNIQDVHVKTGLARRTVSALYNDKASRIDYSTAEKLCKLFDCGMEQLFTFKYEPGKSPLVAKEEAK
jgi:putative transcriptional regulator